MKDGPGMQNQTLEPDDLVVPALVVGIGVDAAAAAVAVAVDTWLARVYQGPKS